MPTDIEVLYEIKALDNGKLNRSPWWIAAIRDAIAADPAISNEEGEDTDRVKTIMSRFNAAFDSSSLLRSKARIGIINKAVRYAMLDEGDQNFNLSFLDFINLEN